MESDESYRARLAAQFKKFAEVSKNELTERANAIDAKLASYRNEELHPQTMGVLKCSLGFGAQHYSGVLERFSDGPELNNQEKDHIRRGNIIFAIKDIRERLFVSLDVAKEVCFKEKAIQDAKKNKH
jgi:hypothetical protein